MPVTDRTPGRLDPRDPSVPRPVRFMLLPGQQMPTSLADTAMATRASCCTFRSVAPSAHGAHQGSKDYLQDSNSPGQSLVLHWRDSRMRSRASWSAAIAVRRDKISATRPSCWPRLYTAATWPRRSACPLWTHSPRPGHGRPSRHRNPRIHNGHSEVSTPRPR
jgi:hypothetical protein